jgi:hypothetical protein
LQPYYTANKTNVQGVIFGHVNYARLHAGVADAEGICGILIGKSGGTPMRMALPCMHKQDSCSVKR